MNIINVFYAITHTETILLFIFQIIYFSSSEKKKYNRGIFSINIIIGLCSAAYYLILFFANIDGYAFRGSILMYILIVLLAIVVFCVNMYLLLLFVIIYKNRDIYIKKISIIRAIKFSILPLLCGAVFVTITLINGKNFKLLDALAWSDFFYGMLLSVVLETIVFAFCSSLAPIGYIAFFKDKK